MTTKWIDNMNLNCAVKLLRCDVLPISNSEDVVSVADKQANAEVKRSVRISRKRTKAITENGNQSDDVKKRNCMIKKPKLSKIEPGKTDASQKEIENTKIQDSSIKSTDSCLINDDLSVTPGSTLSPNNFIDNKETISKQRSIKPKPIKFKISKSIIAVRKKPIVHDVDKDNQSNETVKADNFVAPLKSKTKTSKSITSNRKKPDPNNVSKNNTSSELGESNSVTSIKSPKNKTPKSITSNKKKLLNNVITFVETQHELEINDNFAVPQVPKSKTSKSISNRKKPAVNNIIKSDITNEHEISNTSEIPRKRYRTSLKKEKFQNPDFGGNIVCNTEDSLDDSQNLGKICNSDEDSTVTKLSQNFDDTSMMLRSNNKPPKIKKKWSDEWSGDKLLTNISKSNNEEFSSESTLDVNSKKKIAKTQKSKNANCKKVNSKMLEELNPNNSFVFHTPIPAHDNTDKSSINVPVVQNDCISMNVPEVQNDSISVNVPVVQNDSISITYNIPLEEPIPVVFNDALSEHVGICNAPSSGTSSNISIMHTTGTESTFSTNNDQQSHLSTLEPISDSDYLSVSTIGIENPEMSYGMAILSEAISRQCRELANEQIKKKSPEQDIVEIKSSPKKENSTSRSQVPSAKVSPQRIVKKVSRKIPKCTPKLGLQSVKNEVESRIDHEINLLSKRFDIPSNYLRKTVVDEPLSVFQKKYSKSVTPSMVEISPIDVNAKSGLNVNLEYKLEPIRESAAYEKSNLKDLMLELSKTMPSWSLSIVTNPPRYVISHMSIGTYGVPIANKCIVLDKMFRASVYINQSLEHKLSKRYTTATEIVNLIKELNSI
ncbi:uncharacterized protein LOC100165114 [Acyrthosiphon pisum]|uniref:Uncharacterized protein n=1 Tax=Acyrthosiphon pisum TaxID=7029 RepID=A0A8R2JRS2_ACYPI|nr:uncharacterized protein LOC100165114 [Acyrthosiphon pisum]XP_016663018.1 uncharacterized protein LOC100165114 [Acyrthosiphon pisum]XP_029345129.1 uncharacterized protein LOC100165114 [Acyrthosiphon pisum]|eukprot:XP_001948306.1 PREDICTED: uncharacterized protein LOC100165114 [Acyrthosiphon pisum]